MSTTNTDWIVPGAEVVVYRRRPAEDDAPKRTKVAKVAKQSFTVEGLDERIKLDTLRSKSIGGTWSSWCYVVVAPDDPKVAELMHAAEQDRAAGRASTAVADWNIGAHRRDKAKVQAAIDALTALRDTL